MNYIRVLALLLSLSLPSIGVASDKSKCEEDASKPEILKGLIEMGQPMLGAEMEILHFEEAQATTVAIPIIQFNFKADDSDAPPQVATAKAVFVENPSSYKDTVVEGRDRVPNPHIDLLITLQIDFPVDSVMGKSFMAAAKNKYKVVPDAQGRIGSWEFPFLLNLGYLPRATDHKFIAAIKKAANALDLRFSQATLPDFHNSTSDVVVDGHPESVVGKYSSTGADDTVYTAGSEVKDGKVHVQRLLFLKMSPKVYPVLGKFWELVLQNIYPQQ